MIYDLYQSKIFSKYGNASDFCEEKKTIQDEIHKQQQHLDNLITAFHLIGIYVKHLEWCMLSTRLEHWRLKISYLKNIVTTQRKSFEDWYWKPTWAIATERSSSNN